MSSELEPRLFELPARAPCRCGHRAEQHFVSSATGNRVCGILACECLNYRPQIRYLDRDHHDQVRDQDSEQDPA